LLFRHERQNYCRNYMQLWASGVSGVVVVVNFRNLVTFALTCGVGRAHVETIFSYLCSQRGANEDPARCSPRHTREAQFSVVFAECPLASYAYGVARQATRWQGILPESRLVWIMTLRSVFVRKDVKQSSRQRRSNPTIYHPFVCRIFHCRHLTAALY
jgi:hypothetical protein